MGGLIHMVGLDLDNLDHAQLAWLDQDLAAARRNPLTPWIMVMSHFPVWHSQTAKHSTMSLEHYLGQKDGKEVDESLNTADDFKPCPSSSPRAAPLANGNSVSGRPCSLSSRSMVWTF